MNSRRPMAWKGRSDPLR